MVKKFQIPLRPFQIVSRKFSRGFMGNVADGWTW